MLLFFASENTLQYTPYRGRVLQLAKIPFQIASRWDFRRKTRVFREKAAKNASSFEPVCTVTKILRIISSFEPVCIVTF